MSNYEGCFLVQHYPDLNESRAASIPSIALPMVRLKHNMCPSQHMACPGVEAVVGKLATRYSMVDNHLVADPLA